MKSSRNASKDEIRVIIALGIVAGILAFIQLQVGSGFRFLTLPVQNSTYYPTIEYNLLLLFLSFSVYLLLFTLAMGFDAMVEDNPITKVLKEFADIGFFVGSLGLIGLAINVFLYLEEEATPTGNPVYNTGTYIGFLVLFALFLFAVFIVKRRLNLSRQLAGAGSVSPSPVNRAPWRGHRTEATRI